MSRFAARLRPARHDIAARRLEDHVLAAHYVDGYSRSVQVPLLDLTTTPDREAERATQLIRGETFIVYHEADGFAWGQSESDGYVGYVQVEGLGAPLEESQPVTALLAHAYPEPSIKRRPIASLPFLSKVRVVGEEAGFARLEDSSFVPLPQLVPVAGDFVSHAERFLGAPYLWGGRSVAGLDCSALVQLALAAIGVAAPRDSDMQAASVGKAVSTDMPLERGDLVFWKGHVGLVVGEDLLLHANAHAMAVTREPLSRAAGRIKDSGGGPITGVRRGAATRLDWRIQF